MKRLAKGLAALLILGTLGLGLNAGNAEAAENSFNAAADFHVDSQELKKKKGAPFYGPPQPKRPLHPHEQPPPPDFRDRFNGRDPYGPPYPPPPYFRGHPREYGPPPPPPPPMPRRR